MTTKLKVVIHVELPEELMDLAERLVTVLEQEYDQRYVLPEEEEDDD